jgi:hypothetical protein
MSEQRHIGDHVYPAKDTDLSEELCVSFVSRMMSALSIHAATANPEEVREGLNRLDAYRRAFRGEQSEEEEVARAQRARALLAMWCLDTTVSLSEKGSAE